MLKNKNHTHYKLQLLEYLQRFDTITIAQLDIINSFLEIRKFDKKQVIVNKGEIDNYFNIIIKGVARKYLSTGKKEITLQLATEGHFIDSEISFLKQQPSNVIIETIEPTVFISLSYSNMQLLLEKHRQFERLARTLISNMYIKKSTHYFLQSVSDTRDRFMHYLQNNPSMLQRIPQKYLASYLNIKPETFSRLKHLVMKAE